MSNQQSYLVGVGAANVDIHGQSRKTIVLRDSNPGFLHTSAGGVTRNILENSARQGLPCTLLTAIGADPLGQTILESCKAVSIDVSHVQVIPGHPSSTYMAMLDETGDMYVAMSDMRILEALTGDYLRQNLELLLGAAAIVCDGCLPLPFLNELLALTIGKVPVFVDPVSTAYARKIEPIVGSFYGIKPNRMELEILSGQRAESDRDVEAAAEKVLARGTKCIAVSLGKRGCYYADAEGRRMFRSLRPLEQMANATGAGDAFMAGFVHGYIQAVPLEAQLDYALASGIVAIQSIDTINPEMCDAQVRDTIRSYRM